MAVDRGVPCGKAVLRYPGTFVGKGEEAHGCWEYGNGAHKDFWVCLFVSQTVLEKDLFLPCRNVKQ